MVDGHKLDDKFKALDTLLGNLLTRLEEIERRLQALEAKNPS